MGRKERAPVTRRDGKKGEGSWYGERWVKRRKLLI
jgi:hypothetical protein